jgi:uncharacterized Zn finger protein (UPF0148 family)
MIICPICGVQLHTSDTPENAIKNHRAEQHKDEKPALTFRQGFEYALKLIPFEEDDPDSREQALIARLEKDYVEPK